MLSYVDAQEGFGCGGTVVIGCCASEQPKLHLYDMQLVVNINQENDGETGPGERRRVNLLITMDADYG